MIQPAGKAPGRRVRPAWALILCLAFVGGGVPGASHAVRRDCHNTLIKHVPSPDGTLAVSLYHRDCTSVSYTTARIQRRPDPTPPDDGVVCYLVTLRGRLKIDAVWKDGKHVEISSPDRLPWDFGISSQQDSCNDIKISYDLNVEPAPPEESSDPAVEAAIRKAIELSAPCLAQREHPGNMRMFYCDLDGGEHRSALSLLLMHLGDYRCPISEETYALLKMAGTALEVESSEWEDLRPQVTTSARAALILSTERRLAEAARARIRRKPPGSQGGTPRRLFGVYLDHKKGFIDSTGQLVIEPQFEDTVYDFSDGMAIIPRTLESSPHITKHGYVDATGRVAIPPQFDFAYDFQEGLAWVTMWAGEPNGFIDKTGRLVIPLPRQGNARRFSEGLASVSLEGGHGFIDRTGKTVIEPLFDHAGDFREGLAWVHLRGGKAGYVDKSGKLVIGPADYEVWTDSNFSEGLAMVKVGGKAGYIDRSGRIVIEPQFAAAREFSSGLARITVDGKDGYIDKTGRVVIKPKYDLALDFSEGLAVVEVGGRYGYIDTTGRMLVRPQFDGADKFVEGIARVNTRERGTGYINKRGEYVWGPLH